MPRASGWPSPFILVLVLARVVFGVGLLSGCVDVDGGAIEASWVLRTADGRAIADCTCAQPVISAVRFIAARVAPDGTVGDDVCADQPGCMFSCRRQRGATPFNIAPGRYAISLGPVGQEGQPLGGLTGEAGVRVPAPILRDVVFGRPTQLDALAIEVSCSAVCHGEQSDKVCKR
jgi:hypothetical protein